jgi:hypothetical protein
MGEHALPLLVTSRPGMCTAQAGARQPPPRGLREGPWRRRAMHGAAAGCTCPPPAARTSETFGRHVSRNFALLREISPLFRGFWCVHKILRSVFRHYSVFFPRVPRTYQNSRNKRRYFAIKGDISRYAVEGETGALTRRRRGTDKSRQGRPQPPPALAQGRPRTGTLPTRRAGGQPRPHRPFHRACAGHSAPAGSTWPGALASLEALLAQDEQEQDTAPHGGLRRRICCPCLRLYLRRLLRH